MYQGRHDQEDQTGSVLASPSERRQCHRDPRGRPVDRGQAHQRQCRGDDRGPGRQGDPLQREYGAPDRACRCRCARYFARRRRRGGRHDLHRTQQFAGRAGTQRERLRKAYRSGRIPHYQPRRQGCEDDQHYGKNRQADFDPGRDRRERPDDYQPFGADDPYGSRSDPCGGTRYAGSAYHQPA